MSGYLLICPVAPGRFDGVADYTVWLGAALRTSAPVTVVGLDASDAGAGGAPEPGLPVVSRVTIAGWRDLWRRRREAPFARAIPLVQYVPQLYAGDAGAVWLLMWLVSARLRGRRVLVTVHEYAVPAAASVRRVAARLVLPLVAALIGGVATHVVATIGLTDRRLRWWLFWKTRRIAVVPVGSNIPAPAAPAPRSTAPDRPIVAVLFGQPAAMSVPALTAVGRWAAARTGRVRLRWIGRSRHEIIDCWTRRCGQPADLLDVLEGRPAAEVSAALADADLFVAPLADGVSSRRTTVAAALAHALPIVGTTGASTDTWLADSPAFALAGAADGPALADRLDALAADPGRRAAMAHAARGLYETRFTWDAIARAYEQHLAT